MTEWTPPSVVYDRHAFQKIRPVWIDPALHNDLVSSWAIEGIGFLDGKLIMTLMIDKSAMHKNPPKNYDVD